MTLLSPLALLVGLTAVVPLILHLYQQRRRTVIEFSTNRFFTKAIVRAQRRLRLRRLLLLIVRVATCLLLALALARPLMTLTGLGGREGTRDVVILLDDSLSMQAEVAEAGTAAEPPTHFDTARRLAASALRELAAGDRAAIVTFTGKTLGELSRAGPDAQPTLELGGDMLRLADEVERLEPTFAAGDAQAALAQAAKLFEDATPRHRLVLVLSDMQAGDWRSSDWPQPLQPVPLAVVRTGPPPEDNVVADQLLLSQGTAIVGQPNLLQLRIVNYRRDTTPAEIVLEVDGREALRRPVELAGQNRHMEDIPLVFDQPGEHRLRVYVNFRDALPADNTLYASVHVNPRLPVLVVDGQGEPSDGGRSGVRSGAFFLRTALRAVSDEGDAIQVDTVRPDALTPASLEGYRVAVLCEVKQLSVAQVETLERFVQAGGGLAIFLGEYADRAFYNDVLGNPSRPLGGLMPAELHSFVDAEQTELPLHILAAEVDHPALQRFKGTLRSALAGISVYRAYAVQPRDAWVLAALDRGLPLLVERSYGRGRVLLCTTAPQPRWTNLPLRRAFVPLCNHLMSYLAGGGTAPVEHHVGQALDLPGTADPDQPAYVRVAGASSAPNETRLRAALKVVGAEPLAYIPADEVTQPGFYTLDRAADAKEPAVLAVNVPRRESSPEVLDLAAAKSNGNWRLSALDAAQISDGAGTAAEPAGAGNAHLSLLGRGWLSRGVWDTFLWTVLVLLLLEPLIANQIIRFRQARRADFAEKPQAQGRVA